MTVRCPRCGTLYRRPPRTVLGGDSTFRCARCRHVFDAERDEPAMVAAASEAEDDENRFAFDDEEVDEGEGPVGAEVADDPEPVPRAARSRAAAAPAVSSPARFAVRSVVLVTLLYGALSLYLYARPEAARVLFRQVPLIGPLLVESRLDPAVVRLDGVRGEYRRVRGDSLVFVVSGTAVNDSDVALRGIQVQAYVTGADTQRQVVFCGAAPRDVGNLSVREIALLQTIEPPRDWTLAPGAETPFLVVFPAPPPDLREFGAEVVGVRAPRRA